MVGASGSYRVLGIDPGLTRLGYGVVEEARGKLTELAAGTFETSPETPTPGRLLVTFERLTELIARWAPDAVAVERVFFKVNARTAVPAMQAAGVALLAAARSGAEVYEYPPLEVKRGIAGTGTATKEQVRFMVDQLVGTCGSGEGGKRGADTTDALAVAICHLHARRIKGLSGGLSGGPPAGLSGSRPGGLPGGLPEGLRVAVERAVQRDAQLARTESLRRAVEGRGR